VRSGAWRCVHAYAVGPAARLCSAKTQARMPASSPATPGPGNSIVRMVRSPCQRGPIRVIIGTAHTTIVVPTHYRQICRSAADAHLRGSRTRHPVRKTPYAPLSYTPVIRQSLANRKTTWEGVVSVTPGPHPAITCLAGRALGCLNRPSAVDRFLDSSRQSRFSHVRWPNIFNHTRGLLAHQLGPILIPTTC